MFYFLNCFDSLSGVEPKFGIGDCDKIETCADK